MKTITKTDIVKGLKRIGITKGDHLFVHTSLSSFGHVSGGANTVINALLQAVGPTGTVMVPTFGCTDGVFDPAKSETGLGAVPKAFWKRKNAVRSQHALASVAAIGSKAKWLTQDHENARLAHGKNTPYARLAEIEGKILLLGVDQDRSTFLHIAEELTSQPYLRPKKGSYKDAKGKVRKKTWPYFPGPHRNFIGMQSWLEASGPVQKTLIGSCIAQVMPAKELSTALMARIKDEPALFLSSNPNMPDAIWQNADILRAEFKKEAFLLAADSLYAGQYIEEIIDNLNRFGIDNIVLSYVNDTSWDKIDAGKRRWYLQGLRNAGIKIAAIKLPTLDAKSAISLSKEAKTKTLIIPSTSTAAEITKLNRSGLQICIENLGISKDDIVKLVKKLAKGKANTKIAFNPLGFVQVGENPFLTTYMQSHIKRHIGVLYINDGLATGQRTALEQGLTEIKELISILRCRSFSGIFLLQGPNNIMFDETVAKFLDMLKELGQCPGK